MIFNRILKNIKKENVPKPFLFILKSQWPSCVFLYSPISLRNNQSLATERVFFFFSFFTAEHKVVSDWGSRSQRRADWMYLSPPEYCLTSGRSDGWLVHELRTNLELLFWNNIQEPQLFIFVLSCTTFASFILNNLNSCFFIFSLSNYCFSHCADVLFLLLLFK